MEDDRQIAPPPSLAPSGPADGKEVERAVEVAVPEAEVGGSDRGGEAVVEGLGDPEALVDRIPARPQCPAVHPQLAGVDRPSSSTSPKCASQSARNSAARYSLMCQGLSDFSAPSGASVSRFGVET